jgi:nucleotide-binding universal stress UspA family protein
VRPFPCILVATDFSDCGDGALDQIVDRFPESRIVLLHVVDETTVELVADVAHRSADEVAEDLWSRASRRLAERRSAFEAEHVRVETIIRRGHAATEILGAAQERGADLVVVGSHGLARAGGSEELGGTAERVVRSSRLPVLCIPHPHERS